MRIRSLRTKLVVFLVALIGVVQVSAFWLVTRASSNSAHTKIDEELDVGERVFARILRQNADAQAQGASVLAADFAFREAIATGDTKTLVSALENHGARIKATAVFFVNYDGIALADSLHPDAPAARFAYPDLLAKARSGGNAASIEMLDHGAYQMVAAPVRAPVVIGWIVVCFPLDQATAQELRQMTSLNVSFADSTGGRWSVLESTLGGAQAAALQTRLPSYSEARALNALDMPDGAHQLRVVPIGGDGDDHVVAILQRPIADALAGFGALRLTLLILGVFSIGCSIIGSALIALGVTRPLDTLLGVVRRIRQGDYDSPIDIRRNDEIGVLAQGLDHMRAGIADREQRILKLAYEDTLTKLPNRARFAEQLEAAIATCAAAGRSFAVLVMDLDRFKYVNDTLGHSVGDHVLREVANKVRSLLRAEDSVSRLGGDEFGALIMSSDATQVAARIIAALEEPILYQEQPLDVGGSIGIALYPDHGSNANTLVRNADIAMYAAKRAKIGLTVYDEQYDTSQQEHLSLLGELRRAVENGELRLYYQPKVTLESAAVTSAEALIRWVHPTRGVVPPAVFIPFAEHTGYIRVLTRWVLGEAVRQCGVWLREGLRIQIAVNLSVRDLMNRELPDMISALLREHAVPPDLIGIEITESGFMEDPQHAQKVMARLAALGLHLSIDDYGTGYSSLTYLMKLPVNELKIDRSFISQLMSDSDRTTIVRSTIELGHSLGMKVVAEGVEDPREYALLRELNCDSAQGYYMSPPLPPEALRPWLDGTTARIRDARRATEAQPEPEPQSEPAAERLANNG